MRTGTEALSAFFSKGGYSKIPRRMRAPTDRDPLDILCVHSNGTWMLVEINRGENECMLMQALMEDIAPKERVLPNTFKHEWHSASDKKHLNIVCLLINLRS